MRAFVRMPSPDARREIREGAGLSQADVARELGISTNVVWQYEHGRMPQGKLRVSYYELLERLEALGDEGLGEQP